MARRRVPKKWKNGGCCCKEINVRSVRRFLGRSATFSRALPSDVAVELLGPDFLGGGGDGGVVGLGVWGGWWVGGVGEERG